MKFFPDFGESELYERLLENEHFDEHFQMNISGCDVEYGSGGAHYGKKGIFEGNIIHVDFSSLYPNIMRYYNLASGVLYDAKKINKLIDMRLKYKKEHDLRANALKIVINSIFGASGDKYSEIYDPESCYSVCACGQIIITRLMRLAEPYCTVLNVNTDGLFCNVYNEEGFKDICNAFANKVKIPLEFEHFDKLIQKDVNNYIAISGKSYVSKGSLWKEKTPLDNNCAIIQKALVNYVLNGDYKYYIMANDNLIDYQIIVRRGKAFKGLYLNYIDELTRLSDTNRVFASKKDNGTIIKVKDVNGTLKGYKYPDLPDNIFIDNGDIREKKVPEYLDKSYYIEKVRKILLEWDLIKMKTIMDYV